MQVKTVIFPTNINGKLHCSAMVHVSAAPTGPIYGCNLDATVIEIHTQDGSMEPTQWKLDDLCRLPLERLQNCLTWPSHGLDSYDFIQQYQKDTPNVDAQTPMAVYFYKKL